MHQTTNHIKILCENLAIKDNIVCLLHYGSVKQKEDYNTNSDLDFHLVVKRLDAKSLTDIKDVFSFSDKVDLTYQTVDEIEHENKIIFQNGNQGLYFMHVLASSEALVGENIYKKLIDKLDPIKVKRSVIEKIRYYLWLLRRNYIFERNTKVFKKYFTRIIKDILIVDGVIDYHNISEHNNRQLLNMFIEENTHDLSALEIKLISSINSLEELKNPDYEGLLVFFTQLINKFVWNNLNII